MFEPAFQVRMAIIEISKQAELFTLYLFGFWFLLSGNLLPKHLRKFVFWYLGLRNRTTWSSFDSLLTCVKCTVYEEETAAVKVLPFVPVSAQMPVRISPWSLSGNEHLPYFCFLHNSSPNSQVHFGGRILLVTFVQHSNSDCHSLDVWIL